MLRYVEANPLRAGLVRRAEDWKWGSLGGGEGPVVTASPVAKPSDWTAYVNARVATQELGALRTAVRRGAPYGEAQWAARIRQEIGLQFTARPQGRPPLHAPPA